MSEPETTEVELWVSSDGLIITASARTEPRVELPCVTMVCSETGQMQEVKVILQ